MCDTHPWRNGHCMAPTGLPQSLQQVLPSPPPPPPPRGAAIDVKPRSDISRFGCLQATGLTHIGFGTFKKENQDDFFLEANDFGDKPGRSLFAVFDGHGTNGMHVAKACKTYSPNAIAKILAAAEDVCIQSFPKYVPLPSPFMPIQTMGSNVERICLTQRFARDEMLAIIRMLVTACVIAWQPSLPPPPPPPPPPPLLFPNARLMRNFRLNIPCELTAAFAHIQLSCKGCQSRLSLSFLPDVSVRPCLSCWKA